MKQLFCLLLTLIFISSLCACQGNFGSVNLKDPIEIPEDGIVAQSTVAQIKNENAIAVFTGKFGDFKYEWTILSADITAPKQVDLRIRLEEQADGSLQVTLSQQEAFGFIALLSICLNEQWKAQSATGYAANAAFATATLTGSENTIVNITLDGSVSNFTICPDPLPDEETATEETTEETENTSTEETTETEETEKPAEKDQYLTDPVPEGKPNPIEPQDQEVDNRTAYTCTFSIECSTILNNLYQLDPDKLEMVPSGGVILPKTTVTFYEGESVYDVLQRVCKDNGIHMEASWTPIYNSAYVEGIHNLYEFDCGALSGWMYKVNGWYPNYGSSRYQLQEGDAVEWRYTCDLGNDVGGGYAVGG